MANFAWFTGCFLGGALYLVLAWREQTQQTSAVAAAG
jgi:NCS1 family nucleobase:cation symporter-1